MKAQKQQQNSYPLRMPDEMRARLESSAKESGRSTNAEIVALLTAALDARPGLASISTGALLEEVINRLGARVQIVATKEAIGEAGIASSSSRDGRES